MNQGIIYSIYNQETGKYYVSQTILELNKVWKEHIDQSNRMNSDPLYKDMRRYGLDKFRIKIIEECSESLLNKREYYWIEQYNAYDDGYNLSPGIIEEEPITIPKNIRPKVVRKNTFKNLGNGKHHSIKLKAINVNTLEEKEYDSLTECAQDFGILTSNLSRALKHGWKVKGHRIIKLEDKSVSYPIYGVDKITNRIRYSFPSIRSAGRELGNGYDGGCRKSLNHPHKYTWKGCYWFYR